MLATYFMYTYVNKKIERLSWCLAFERTTFHGMIMKWNYPMLHTNTTTKCEDFHLIVPGNERKHTDEKKKKKYEQLPSIRTWNVPEAGLSTTGMQRCLILINDLWPTLKRNLLFFLPKNHNFFWLLMCKRSAAPSRRCILWIQMKRINKNVIHQITHNSLT